MAVAPRRGGIRHVSQPIATGIPVSHLHLVWADLWPLLEPAYALSREKADILAGLQDRRFQAWAVYDTCGNSARRPIAAIVTRIWRDTETGETDCRLWLVGGCRAHEWLPDFIAKVSTWARIEGCTRLTAGGRRGWWPLVRAYGGHRIADEDGSQAWALEIR